MFHNVWWATFYGNFAWKGFFKLFCHHCLFVCLFVFYFPLLSLSLQTFDPLLGISVRYSHLFKGRGGCSVVFLNVQRYIQIADLSIYPCHRWHPWCEFIAYFSYSSTLGLSSLIHAVLLLFTLGRFPRQMW